MQKKISKSRVIGLILALLLIIATLPTFKPPVKAAVVSVVDNAEYKFEYIDGVGTLTVKTPTVTYNWVYDNSVPHSDLERVVFTNTVITIPANTGFSGGSGITAIDFSNATSLVTIGDGAFSSNSNLAAVDFSGCESLETIGNDAFWKTALTDVNLSGCESLKTIGNGAFSTSDFDFPAAPLLTVNLSGCTSLVTIGDGAFGFQNRLATVDFSGCTSLATIGEGAFYDCRSLKTLTFGGLTPPAISSGTRDVFYNVPDDGIIYCPPSAIPDYEALIDAQQPQLTGWMVREITPPPPPPQPPNNNSPRSPVPPIDETVKPGTDKPEEKPEVTEPEVTEPVTPTLPTGPQTAKPVTNLAIVDGVEYAIASYNINDNNYFKLRDIAAALSGSKKPFEVAYNPPTIELTSGATYTLVGGELIGKTATENAIANPTDNRIVLDGNEVKFTAYNIKDNNYFKLRDIAEAFDFSVVWDEATGNIIIDTTKGYTA